ARDGTPPAELLEQGRAEVRRYGGVVRSGEVVKAGPSAPGPDGDLRFSITLADGDTLTARRLLVATGLRDVLPDVPGLAAHWGGAVVHCPYCHGWEVRDEPIGVLATGAASVHQALLFSQLTDDLVYLASGTPLDDDARARLSARRVRVVETPVDRVLSDAEGRLAGVVLADGQLVARRVLAVASRVHARLDGLEALGLPVQDLPNNLGSHVVSGQAGTTEVPGVWVAG